jgi:DNA-binding XRE family transcriptional regulator
VNDIDNADTRVGVNVRHLAGMHSIRQAELAALIGISPQGLWNIVHGRSEPRSRTVHRLAEAFAVSMEDLFSEPGECVRAGAASFERAPARAAAAATRGEEVAPHADGAWPVRGR